MPALGYAALPPSLVKDAFAAIRRVNGAADPGPVTGANCPNPYLTGALWQERLGSPRAPVRRRRTRPRHIS